MKEMLPFEDRNNQRPMLPEEKASEVVCGLEDSEKTWQTCPYFDDLQYQLAQSYYWSGSFMKDYFFFVANWHPFLGMLLSHPYHPWTKKERFLTFVVSCSITMLPVALFMESFHGGNQAEVVLGQVAIFMGITLPVMLIEVALYWLSIGDIFCKGGCCAQIVGGTKNCCLCVSLFISAICILASLAFIGDHDPYGLIKPFLISRCQSYVTWFPIWFILPCLGFAHCWSMENNALQSALQ
eukprot:CAMPEP_0115186476 /NCGR_PEP_ID=MMETSP0270-20121206/10000_1 /TAXON_ID=71861 /ORGANISM="Scrippsiella trochoidea, Strain CCMP3099" /LENGTH=238 /DNA_ID=CAMNT_0002599599 /DNA_START=124 /DNA_END=840 /DNA_ORIENTATION=-